MMGRVMDHTDRDYDEEGWEYPSQRPTTRREHAPTFLSAPFSARTWRETLQALLNLPLGVIGFCLFIPLLTASLPLMLTFVGFPVLAVALLVCRGLGAAQRACAVSLLGVEAEPPAPPLPTRPGIGGWLRATLLNGASWRSALYQLLLLPFGIFSFVLVTTLWALALQAASYPLWQWVFPTYVGQPGMQLYTDDNHTHYLAGTPMIAGYCALGIVLVFLTPWVAHGVAAVQRTLVRGLLAR